MIISARKNLIIVLIVLLFNFTVICVSSSSDICNFEINSGDLITNKIYSNDTNILRHGVKDFGIFTNSSDSHYWILPNIREEQSVYFSISPKNILNITVINPYGIESEFTEEQHSTKI